MEAVLGFANDRFQRRSYAAGAPAHALYFAGSNALKQRLEQLTERAMLCL